MASTVTMLVVVGVTAIFLLPGASPSEHQPTWHAATRSWICEGVSTSELECLPTQTAARQAIAFETLGESRKGRKGRKGRNNKNRRRKSAPTPKPDPKPKPAPTSKPDPGSRNGQVSPRAAPAASLNAALSMENLLHSGLPYTSNCFGIARNASMSAEDPAFLQCDTCRTNSSYPGGYISNGCLACPEGQGPNWLRVFKSTGVRPRMKDGYLYSVRGDLMRKWQHSLEADRSSPDPTDHGDFDHGDRSRGVPLCAVPSPADDPCEIKCGGGRPWDNGAGQYSWCTTNCIKTVMASRGGYKYKIDCAVSKRTLCLPSEKPKTGHSTATKWIPERCITGKRVLPVKICWVNTRGNDCKKDSPPKHCQVCRNVSPSLEYDNPFTRTQRVDRRRKKYIGGPIVSVTDTETYDVARGMSSKKEWHKSGTVNLTHYTHEAPICVEIAMMA